MQVPIRLFRGMRTADCGSRSAVIVGSADCQRTDFFLFRGRDVAIGMNSVKILHAVRSAITAIAEHRVSPVVFIVSREVNSAFHPSGEVKSSTGLSDWGVSTCLG